MPYNVAPGQQVTFSFTATAPNTPGTYNFQWRMLREGIVWFGDYTPNVAVQVQAQAPPYSAAYVTQSAPVWLLPGTLGAVSVTMRNTGTATWRASPTDVFLATQEPQDNFYWCIQNNPYNGQAGGNRVLLPYDVAPGQQVTFAFNIKPLGCVFTGPAPLRFRMLSQQFGTFGEETPDPHVSVTSGADYISESVPTVMVAGSSNQVTVSFKNTTPVTWTTADGYSLGSQGPAGNTVWGVNRVPLPGPVAPNATVAFTFTAHAPNVQSTFVFQWEMQKDGLGYFGVASPAQSVRVLVRGQGRGLLPPGSPPPFSPNWQPPSHP